MALKPAATNASSNLKEVGSSAVQPKTFPPKTRGEISSPELPSLRLFISILSMLAPPICPRALDEILRSKGTWRRPRLQSSFAGVHVRIGVLVYGDSACLWNCLEHRRTSCGP